MSNTLITPSVIAKEALMQVENNCVMSDCVHRTYKKEFVKVGQSVSIRKPVKFISGTGADITSNVQDVSEDSTSVTIDTQRHVAWKFNSSELTLTIEEYSERYIKPAAIELANKIDMAGCALYKDVALAAGTAGTTPSSFMDMGYAGQYLDENAVPSDNRKLIINPAASWKMADAFKNFYSHDVSKKARRGVLADIADFDIRKDQNIAYHTAGDTAGTVLVKGASQTGSTLTIDGLTAATGTIKKGDVFTLAGVYHVNPVSRESTGKLQQFTVTADATAVSNEVEVSISPSIVTSGAYQTVTAAPADNAAVTFVASHSANLAFHKNAFALVTVPLVLPDSVNFKHRITHNGISLRVIKDYDILKDEEIIRLDVLFGWKAIYPELACRLLG
jgi:hypothetical protein